MERLRFSNVHGLKSALRELKSGADIVSLGGPGEVYSCILLFANPGIAEQTLQTVGYSQNARVGDKQCLFVRKGQAFVVSQLQEWFDLTSKT